MAKLAIETSLNEAGKKDAKPFYEKYIVLKQRLLEVEYSYWNANFPGGNDHGPLHIQRVLEQFNNMIGSKPLSYLSVYELFLSMMAILYHDIGLLRGRSEHASVSALLMQEEKNEYLFDQYDREILSAVIFSHSSSTSIDAQCAKFSSTEIIRGYSVRPRVIAALVRLADELDEDYRRADPVVAQRVNIPEESRFFWQFSQRVLGVQAHLSSHEIFFNVKFSNEDVARSICVNGQTRSFLGLFVEKLLKINRERMTVNTYLPDNLQYHRMIILVRPIDNHATWKRLREFIITDSTVLSEIIAGFPELLLEPVKKHQSDILELIRTMQLEMAINELKKLEDVIIDLPDETQILILYDRACAESLSASISASKKDRDRFLDNALHYIEEWLILGQNGAWLHSGQTPQNAIYMMGMDTDLRYLLSKRRSSILEKINEEYKDALPDKLPPKRRISGGGGCIPSGTIIQALNGYIPIENLRVGDSILSFDKQLSNLIVAKIFDIIISRTSKCIRFNQGFVCTPTQPLYIKQDGWLNASEVQPGDQFLDSKGNYQLISQVEQMDGYFVIYDLSTNHSSHNFIANDFVCHNKRQRASF